MSRELPAVVVKSITPLEDEDGPLSLREIIGLRIAEERAKLGISGNELARRAGMTSIRGWAIHQYERADLVPTVETLVKVAAGLGVSVGYLIGETDEKELPRVPQQEVREK